MNQNTVEPGKGHAHFIFKSFPQLNISFPDQSFRYPHEEALSPYPPKRRTAKTLIRHVILLVLSSCGSLQQMLEIEKQI